MLDTIVNRTRRLYGGIADRCLTRKKTAPTSWTEFLQRTKAQIGQLPGEQLADFLAQGVTFGFLCAQASFRPDRGAVSMAQVKRRFGRLYPHFSAWIGSMVDVATDCQPSAVKDYGSILRRQMHGGQSVERDPIARWYEPFLSAYDSPRRLKQGFFATPQAAANFMARSTDELLRARLHLPMGLADARRRGGKPVVCVLDPAAGTGTLAAAAMDVIYDSLRRTWRGSGLSPQSQLRRWRRYVKLHLLPRLYGFENSPTVWLLCQLRLGLHLRRLGYRLTESERIRVYLANALAAPAEEGQPTTSAESAAADETKRHAPWSVILANPPYQRESYDPAKFSWLKTARPETATRSLWEDYTAPVQRAKLGGYLKNLYNQYVYFWRLASWLAFERDAQEGVVTILSPSSFVEGAAFLGLRQHTQSIADEIHLLDLEGDRRGARLSMNLFDITIPIAITSIVRTNSSDNKPDATLYYQRIDGDRQQKLETCRHSSLESPHRHRQSANVLSWRPKDVGHYFTWPALADLFVWRHSGVQFKRKWPIGQTVEQLERRWNALLEASDQAAAFRETSGRRISESYNALCGGRTLPAIAELSPDAPLPPIVPYGYRSFDTQWAIADPRLGDRMRPFLWRAHSPQQVYLICPLSQPLGPGPALVASAHIPDLDHFRGSFGGKNVIPLWQDAQSNLSNVAADVLTKLRDDLGESISAEDLFAYVYSVLANPGYYHRFQSELRRPGPRLPITRDLDLFRQCVCWGRRLLWLHTGSLRFADAQFDIETKIHQGRPVSPSPADYPRRFAFDASRGRLTVGDGYWEGVSPLVWDFSISGLQVVKSWLGYRMKQPRGRKSSPLDEIRPHSWTADLSGDLSELLRRIEQTLRLRPQLDEYLTSIQSSPLFRVV